MVNGFGNYFPTKYFGAHLDLEDLINWYNQKKKINFAPFKKQKILLNQCMKSII